MSHTVAKETIQHLFTEARTHHNWAAQPIDAGLLKELYHVAKFGPTSVNCNPGRFIFLQSEKSKEKLLPALMGSNQDQVKAAPVTVIIAQDNKFFEHLGTLFPAFDAKPMFANSPALAESTAFRNSSLQGAYLMIAARALGLDVCPMSGFDNAKVDEAFFKGSAWKSNFICNIGYGDATKLYPRGARLDFEVACKIE